MACIGWASVAEGEGEHVDQDVLRGGVCNCEMPSRMDYITKMLKIRKVQVLSGNRLLTRHQNFPPFPSLSSFGLYTSTYNTNFPPFPSVTSFGLWVFESLLGVATKFFK